MRIEDISPRDGNTAIVLERWLQSVSGKALCCAISGDSSRAYVGGHSGVWRSDNGGLSWRHPERPQPPPGQTSVPGALLAPNVYDLLISPSSPDVVLAVTGRDARRPSAAGIYRSIDGALTWTRVHAYHVRPDLPAADATGCLAAVPDNPRLVYAVLCSDDPRSLTMSGARSDTVARSSDGGATWTDLPRPSFSTGRWHVVAGKLEGGLRRVYAIGNGVTYSVDGGDTWLIDPMQINIGPPSDGPGASWGSLGIHPRNPSIIYVLVGDGQALWRGQFPPLPSTGPGTWRQLPTPPKGLPNTTPSGSGFVVPHVTPEGELCLVVSDQSTTHVCAGEPTKAEDWHRIEDKNCHLDPHGFALTPSFRPHFPDRPQQGPAGRALLVNDGGANVSVNGGRSWINGQGLSTLGVVNTAVNAVPGQPAALCIGMGDNSGFSSPDGGASWETQDYVGGDNDCCFADPLQADRLIVFSPRFGAPNQKKGWLLYKGANGNPPDSSLGTQQRSVVEGPPPLNEVGLRERGHNLVSNFHAAGYRPLVLTRQGEPVRSDGDLVLIRFTASGALVMRTTRMSEITRREDWVTSATEESPSAITFQQGPPLPHGRVCIVQASGGHAAPTYYVGDQPAGTQLWKWTRGMAAWQRLVPGPVSGGAAVPAAARRYFVDPYRPSLVYVLDLDHIRRSDDGGATWTVDSALERAVTENGAFPFGIGMAGVTDGTPMPILLCDMLFDPFRPGCRFAVSPAGVFHTQDGRNWTTLLRASAMAVHPTNAAYDPVSCERALYLATYGRGLLRLAPIPPDWDYPAGSLQTAVGRITFLRVHDVGSGFGPPHDALDAEIIVLLDSEPEKAFGIKLRPGADARKARGMLDLLRDAFRRDAVIRLEFFRSGCRTGTIHRIIET